MFVWCKLRAWDFEAPGRVEREQGGCASEQARGDMLKLDGKLGMRVFEARQIARLCVDRAAAH